MFFKLLYIFVLFISFVCGESSDGYCPTRLLHQHIIPCITTPYNIYGALFSVFAGKTASHDCHFGDIVQKAVQR